MLAPRKKLWSTPDSVIEKVIEAMPLTASDCVVDVGCGDGRVIFQWAKHVTTERQDDDVTRLPSFIGVDIDNDRIEQAELILAKHKADGSIHKSILVSFICANALKEETLLADATVVFLYLIPRGLRIMYPLLRQALADKHSQDGSKLLGLSPSLRVATYMSPLDIKPVNIIKIAVPHQPEAGGTSLNLNNKN
ncbi:hypothetical protein MPSEU_000492600 [Mayamaea pseudoterrestris]|nr:hypothetical protein MPSEU_000492600 [Mayamaea pseudoterrestris]